MPYLGGRGEPEAVPVPEIVLDCSETKQRGEGDDVSKNEPYVGRGVEIEGGCTRDTPRCAKATNMRQRTPRCCVEHNKAILSLVAAALDEARVPWWVDYGTALGFLMNGGMYWNDKDCDLGIHASGREVLVDELVPYFNALGFHATYNQKQSDRWKSGDRVKVRLSEENHTNCDIFIWNEIPDPKNPGRILLDRYNYVWVDKYKGREFPREWVVRCDQDGLPLPNTTSRGEWEGIDVAVPYEVESLVVHRYGRKYMKLPPARHDGRFR